MFRKTLAITGAALVLFHVWLLVSQIADGRLADPSALLRWAVAAGLVWGLVLVQRQGSSVFWGRKAVSIWLLAALLHAPAVADRIDASGFDLPTVVVTIVEITIAAGVVLTGLLASRRHKFQPPVVVARVEQRLSPLSLLSPDGYFTFSPRPPPLS